MSNECETSRATSVVYLNVREFHERTKGMSDRQVAQTIRDIIDLAQSGRMRNGPAVRIDPPECLEDK